MPRTYNYSSQENIKKLKTFLKKPKTIKEIIKKFNLSSQNQGRQFITAATFKIEIYEFTQNGQLLYGIMKLEKHEEIKAKRRELYKKWKQKKQTI